ncbi:fibronectin type III domain-containing protein [Sphingobacterium pedocola]|uniref:Fibronectin type-III domain-containing protein n=1 Tax=Sphingobacterium pedocola TaxID=2082722 RepID=A0ABR9T3P4_9SPHI|nr:fibronectin type III domain-containing protein [Sphingobacterium pedocola]MBE8719960.1 hypothetical protein [Sphingobacterium pedocola]
MRKDKVKTNYEKVSEFELSTLAGRVLKAIQEPAAAVYFPNPNPTLPVLEELVNDYIQKHEIASRRGSALEIGQKNESKTRLLEGLQLLATYVNQQAGGQISVLLSSGLILANQPKSKDTPLIPLNLKLRDGRVGGQMRLDFQAVKDAWQYEVEIGQSAVGSAEILWERTVMTTSSRSNVLIGFEPGVKYYVRVRALNGKGIGDWSEPVSLIAR